jgi:hypothetical protein
VPETTTNPKPCCGLTSPTGTPPIAKAKPKWAKAGPCRTPNDRAADESRCGNRAASMRPGGK